MFTVKNKNIMETETKLENYEETEEKIFNEIINWIEGNKNLNKIIIENKITEEIKRQHYLKESWQEEYAKERIKDKIKKEAKGRLNKRYDLKFLLGWSRHITPKNLVINAVISFIPMALTIGILREVGLGGALIIVGVMFGYICLAGILREKLMKYIHERKN